MDTERVPMSGNKLFPLPSVEVTQNVLRRFLHHILKNTRKENTCSLGSLGTWRLKMLMLSDVSRRILHICFPEAGDMEAGDTEARHVFIFVLFYVGVCIRP